MAGTPGPSPAASLRACPCPEFESTTSTPASPAPLLVLSMSCHPTSPRITTAKSVDALRSPCRSLWLRWQRRRQARLPSLSGRSAGCVTPAAAPALLIHTAPTTNTSPMEQKPFWMRDRHLRGRSEPSDPCRSQPWFQRRRCRRKSRPRPPGLLHVPSKALAATMGWMRWCTVPASRRRKVGIPSSSSAPELRAACACFNGRTHVVKYFLAKRVNP